MAPLLCFVLLGGLCVQHDDFRVGLGRIARLAIAQSGMSVKSAALTMGIDHAQLSRALDGVGNLSMTQMRLLPREFWRRFAVLVVVEVGVPKEIRVGQRLRMARARMRSTRYEEQAS